jgi:hypothetical protein
MKTQEILEREGSKYFVTDPETGLRLELKGYGSLKGKLDLDPGIDLTKPIWEQVYGEGSVTSDHEAAAQSNQMTTASR